MKQIFTAIIFLFSILSFSQDNRYGKVSEEDFKTYATPINPSDNATVIYKSQNIKFDYREGTGFVQINEVQERIIIHNKKGFDWATKKIKLYNKTTSSSEKLQNLKGYTYTLENGKLEKEKLKSEGMFEEVANKYWKYESFTMPNVKEGCIVEYTYEIESPYSQIDAIDIQYTIPILKYELKISTPEYFNYNKLLNPKAHYIPVIKESKKSNSITFNNKTRSSEVGKPVKITFNQSTTEYQDNIITIDASNIPALKEEPFVDNLDNYRAKLILELSSVKFPNEPMESFSSTWENVTKTIYNDEDFGGQLKKNGFYEDDLKMITATETDDIIKTYLIHEYVKDKVKWNGYLGYTSENGVRKSYKDGVGNVGDINLMLISMLRTAGINANPVLISTKDNGIPLFPTRSGFNYVICAVVINNNTLLLDATQKFSTANILPIMSLNWLGRVIRNDGSSDWIELSPTMLSREVVSLNVKLNQDLSASGKVRNQFTDHQAFRIRGQYDNYNDQQIVESLEKGKGELVVSNIENENMKDVSQPILQSYDYTYGNAMEEIGGKLYFSPLIFLSPNENPFKDDKRSYPIDFVYPIVDKYMVNIMMPEGYTVETLPESAKFEFNGTDGTFTYLARLNGNSIQFTITTELNKILILPSEYEHFKKFYQLMIEKQTEKVVLKKV
jgi:hypothetical protein